MEVIVNFNVFNMSLKGYSVRTVADERDRKKQNVMANDVCVVEK